jgi:hypothetical protein
MADASPLSAPQTLSSLGPLPLAPAPGPGPALDGQACAIGGG